MPVTQQILRLIYSIFDFSHALSTLDFQLGKTFVTNRCSVRLLQPSIRVKTVTFFWEQKERRLRWQHETWQQRGKSTNAVYRKTKERSDNLYGTARNASANMNVRVNVSEIAQIEKDA